MYLLPDGHHTTVCDSTLLWVDLIDLARSDLTGMIDWARSDLTGVDLDTSLFHLSPSSTLQTCWLA